MEYSATMTADKPVDTANSLSLQDFYDQLIPSAMKDKAQCIQPNVVNTLRCPDALSPSHVLSLETATTVAKDDLGACFDLIVTTSSTDYAASSIGWHPSQKKREMRLPDLRYLLVKSRGRIRPLEAFLSFMLTYEDGHEVVYCYEVHMMSHLQGKGLGRYLMEIVEQVGARAGMEKVMLTAFLSNKGALGFYKKLRYSEDEYSPEPRTLRNGTVKLPDFVILSKPLDACL